MFDAEIRTGRLRLRPLALNDLEAYIEIQSNEEYARFVSIVIDVDRARRTLGQEVIDADARGYGLFGVEMLSTGSPAIVAYCGILPTQTERASVELVCAVARRWWRQQIGFEACSEVVAWSFNTLQVAEVVARVAVSNQNSLGLVQALRMAPHGKQWDSIWKRCERTFVLRRAELIMDVADHEPLR